ncbi:MAG TPA: hypothetical protein VLY46_05970 [Usitatibacter sp.]|nr:hypothetical protein [Usitatibacter sp.]
MPRIHLRVAACVVAGIAGHCLAAPTLGGCPVFPSDNYWNTPVDALPVHPSSSTWVSTIGESTKLHPDWGNVLADNYGIPYATVGAGEAQVPILFPPEGYGDESDPGPYPIPPDAPIEGGSSSDGDRHVIVVDTGNCVLYELYYAFPLSGGSSWSAYSAAKWDLRSNALRPDTWTSADAAGLPIFPGLVRWDEVAAGEIDHAIRFTASRIWGSSGGKSYYLWPARHASGSSTDSSRPPMGARFRLKASFDISGFDPRTQVILRAFKRYGLVLADAGSNWYFQGVSDARWPDVVLDELKSIAGSNFEAVDTSSLEVDPASGEARQASGAIDVQGLWWRSPAGSESGWGVNLTQQGDILFATWFTYDASGKGLWLVMSRGDKVGTDTYSGTLYATTGPAFDADPWDPNRVVATGVGSATFAFTDSNDGTFTYTVNGTTQSKPITREIFAAPLPTCVEAETLAGSTNYSDLWWRSPAGSESGWGVNLTQQGDILFATWFTYDAAGDGEWLVMPRGEKTAEATYSGPLYRTAGPSFDAVPWDPAGVAAMQVGSATFSFTDANDATFSYTVDGVSQSKPITREIYGSPATVCN